MKSLKSQNFYEVLGVPRHATAEEIRAAYEISRHTFQENSLATYSLFTDAENEEILSLISKAYETLFNPDMRRAYDSQLDRSEVDLRPARRPLPTGIATGMAAGSPIVPPPSPLPAPPSSQQLSFAPVRRQVEEFEPRAAPVAMAPVPPVSVSMATPAAYPEIRATPPRPVPPASGNTREPNAQATEFAKSLICFDGASLKKLRQLHGISLEELSERTKIRRMYLEYLEEEQFQFLPAAVYVKGFISIVAGVLGVPAQRAAEDYMTRYQGREH